MRLRVLGAIAVDDAPVRSARVRRLLAVLALEPGRVVPVDRLVARVWPDEPPHHGEAALHSVVARARKVLGEFAKNPQEPEPQQDTSTLTERERDVLELLVSGVTSNRALAEKLYVSENTVKYHLRNILDKLHLNNRAQVVAYAVRHGLVDPGRPDR